MIQLVLNDWNKKLPIAAANKYKLYSYIKKMWNSLLFFILIFLYRLSHLCTRTVMYCDSVTANGRWSFKFHVSLKVAIFSAFTNFFLWFSQVIRKFISYNCYYMELNSGTCLKKQMLYWNKKKHFLWFL